MTDIGYLFHLLERHGRSWPQSLFNQGIRYFQVPLDGRQLRQRAITQPAMGFEVFTHRVFKNDFGMDG